MQPEPMNPAEHDEKAHADPKEEQGERSSTPVAPDITQNPFQRNDRGAPPVTKPDVPVPADKDDAQPLQPYPGEWYATGGTGWSAMAKVVREVDAQKVQDYKEDIDTILVFAGLFSAVMTAFLIESYHNLSQDPAQVMIFLMQQVATQTHSYSINGAFLNSTVDPLPPTIPEFQPTVNAIRVNVLWFASLTLSLVSASFSILVKQWLREYLAGEYTSPQARLRIRHFRYPGLEDWKVFEIAAVIPLLLQLALALFLIGLCFFTADVHDTVGHTTLPLVAGWGFLFIAASFAPALSPRCPYKTTLLKSAMKALRMCIFRVFMWAKKTSLRAIEPLTHLPSKWSFENLAYEEEDAVLTDRNDIDILVSVDSIQSDEHLLAVMWDAVQQTQLDPAESVTFVRSILGHRIQRDIATIPPSEYLDLRRLPKRTTTSIMLMVSDLLRQEIIRQSGGSTQTIIEWTSWMKDCLYILLSETNIPLPPAANQTFSLLLCNQIRYQALFGVIVARISNPDTLPHVLDRLRGALVQQKSVLIFSLYSVLETFICTNHRTDIVRHKRLADIVKDHPEITPTHIQPVVEIIASSLLTRIHLNMYWYPWLTDRINVILELPKHPEYFGTAVKLVRTILLQAKATTIFSRYPMGLNWGRLYKTYAQELFIEAIVSANVQECYSIIWNITRALNWQWTRRPESADNKWERIGRLDPLESSYMVLQALQKATKVKGVALEKHWSLVRNMWPDVQNGLKIVAGRGYENHPDIARGCLQIIDEIDVPSPPDYEDEEAFVAWAEAFHSDKSWFPDDCIRSLAQFLPAGEHVTSYRLRRVRLLDSKQPKKTIITAGNVARIVDEATRDESNGPDSTQSRARSPLSTLPTPGPPLMRTMDPSDSVFPYAREEEDDRPTALYRPDADARDPNLLGAPDHYKANVLFERPFHDA